MTMFWGKGLLMAAVLAFTAWSLPAQAIMLCDCCAKDKPAECGKACAEAQNGICRPVVLFDKTAKTRTNPLNGIDLKYLDLANASPLQLGALRRWAEKARAKAEKDFRLAKKMILWGHRKKETFAEAEKIRDEALVNYNHIIRAYRDAWRKRREGN